MKTLQSIKQFPFIKGFGDYHDITVYGKMLQDFFGNQVQYEELPFEQCSYIGLFFVRGERPSELDIEENIPWELR